MPKEDNIFPLYEFTVHRLYKLMRRQLMDDTIDSSTLKKALYKALRSLMWYYKDVDQSPIIGCQFEVLPDSDMKNLNSNNIRGFLLLNSGAEIAFNNLALNDCIINLFPKKIINEKKVFFHWKVIENFENENEQKKSKKRKK
jgi:hypothetical protein